MAAQPKSIAQELKEQRGAARKATLRDIAGPLVGAAEGAAGRASTVGPNPYRAVHGMSDAEKALAVGKLAALLKDMDRMETDLTAEVEKSKRVGQTNSANLQLGFLRFVGIIGAAKMAASGNKEGAALSQYGQVSRNLETLDRDHGLISPDRFQSEYPEDAAKVRGVAQYINDLGGAPGIKAGHLGDVQNQLLTLMEHASPRQRLAQSDALRQATGLSYDDVWGPQAGGRRIAEEAAAKDPLLRGAYLYQQARDAKPEAEAVSKQVSQQALEFNEQLLHAGGIGFPEELRPIIEAGVALAKGEVGAPAEGTAAATEATSGAAATGPSVSYADFATAYKSAAAQEAGGTEADVEPSTTEAAPEAGGPPAADAPASERKAWVEQTSGGSYSLDEKTDMVQPVVAPAAQRVAGVTVEHAGLAGDTRKTIQDEMKRLLESDESEVVATRNALLQDPRVQDWAKERGYDVEGMGSRQLLRELFREKRANFEAGGAGRALGRATIDANILSGVSAATPLRSAQAGVREALRGVFRPRLIRKRQEMAEAKGATKAPDVPVTAGSQAPGSKAPTEPEGRTAQAAKPAEAPEEAPRWRDVQDPTNPEYTYRQYETGKVAIVGSPKSDANPAHPQPVDDETAAKAITEAVGPWASSEEAKQAATSAAGEAMAAGQIAPPAAPAVGFASEGPEEEPFTGPTKLGKALGEKLGGAIKAGKENRAARKAEDAAQAANPAPWEDVPEPLPAVELGQSPEEARAAGVAAPTAPERAEGAERRRALLGQPPSDAAAAAAEERKRKALLASLAAAQPATP